MTESMIFFTRLARGTVYRLREAYATFANNSFFCHGTSQFVLFHRAASSSSLHGRCDYVPFTEWKIVRTAEMAKPGAWWKGGAWVRIPSPLAG